MRSVPSLRSTRRSGRPWRRAAVVVAATALAAPALAACDTDDGRTMREPTPEQRIAATTTSTTTTTVASTDPLDAGDFKPVTLPGSDAGDSAGSEAGAGSVVAVEQGPAEQLAITLPWSDTEPIARRYTCRGLDVSPAVDWGPVPANTQEMAVLMFDIETYDLVWAVSGIDPQAGALAEGAPTDGLLTGINAEGTTGYAGPCPSLGERRTYALTVYAVGEHVQIADLASAEVWQSTLDGAALVSASVLADTIGI